MTTQLNAPTQELTDTAWAGGPGHRVWKRGRLELHDNVLRFTDDAGTTFFEVSVKDARPEFGGMTDPLCRLRLQTPDGPFDVVFWQNPYLIGLAIPKPYAKFKIRQVAAPWKRALSH